MTGEPRSGERQRRLRFALAAVVLLLAAGLLSWTSPANDDAAAPTPTPAAPSTSSPPAVVVPDPPAPAASIARVPERRLVGVARRFLADYLPYLYGQRSGRRVAGSSRQLARRLAQARLRVPPAARRRHPRLLGLRVGARVRDVRAWQVRARVADGSGAVYPIELLIGWRDGRLVVVALGSGS